MVKVGSFQTESKRGKKRVTKAQKSEKTVQTKGGKRKKNKVKKFSCLAEKQNGTRNFPLCFKKSCFLLAFSATVFGLN